MIMSNQSPITVVLANRPRLFRELLQHALNTMTPHFRVVEATDGTPSPALLRDAQWLVVDEDSANEATKLSAAHPHLGILALEGRGSRARVLASTAHNSGHGFSDVPTLSQLFNILSQQVTERAS
jgi:hypothetical protein